jgi:HIV Tat-specific factor 1
VLKRENKKRKEPEDYTGVGTGGNASAGPSIKRGRSDKPLTERKSKNTAVYVTGLPQDAEVDEIVDRFSRCGVIEEDDDGEPKVKMYAREDGSFSGEALVVYFKEDSVMLALSLLDEGELRLGDPSTIMHISKADFTHKGNSSHADGDQPRKVVDKKRITKRIGKMQRCVSANFWLSSTLTCSPGNSRSGMMKMGSDRPRRTRITLVMPTRTVVWLF